LRLGEEALGKPGKYLMIFLFTIMGFMCMLAYLLMMRDSISVYYSDFEHIWVIATLITFPLVYVRKLTNLVVFSILNFLCVGVIVVLSIYVCLKKISEDGFTFEQKVPTMNDLTKVIPIYVLAFSAQAGSSIILSSLKVNSDANRSKVTIPAFLMVLMF